MSVSEPWKCDSCGMFMYHWDAQGYAVSGAPMPHYVSLEFKNVCSVCHSLAVNRGLDTKYWYDLQRDYLKAETARHKKNKSLGSSGNYLGDGEAK